MAYWMTHLRVAEALLRCLPEGISLPHYYAGSIAPDCGRTEWNEDGTPRYLPGRVVTHWLKKDEALDRCLIDFEGFYNAMMPQAADDGARAFYWGYYIHLITDAMWQERVLRPRRESLAEPSKENIAAMRADLKLADLADYRENPHYPPLETLRNTPSFPNRYLDDYTEDAIENFVEKNIKFSHIEAGYADEGLLPRLGILGQKFMGLTPEQCVDMAKKYVKESLGAAEGTENTAKLMEYIDKPGAIRLIFNTEKPIPVEAFDTLSDTDPSIKLDVNTGPKTALELMADLEKK